MVIQPLQWTSGALTGRTAFSVTDQGTYLALDNSINESSRTASARVTGGGSQITIALTLSGATTGTAVASGNFGTTSRRWSGRVNLSVNPLPALWSALARAGFNINAVGSQLAEASCFAPVYRALTEIRTARLPPHRLQPSPCGTTTPSSILLSWACRA